MLRFGQSEPRSMTVAVLAGRRVEAVLLVNQMPLRRNASGRLEDALVEIRQAHPGIARLRIFF
jgi:hypothetical protein